MVEGCAEHSPVQLFKSTLCARYGLLYSNTTATVHSVTGLYVVLIRSSPGNHHFKPLATYEPRSHVRFASLRAPATYTFQAPYIRCTSQLLGRSSSYKRSGLRQAEPTKNVAGFEHVDPNSLLWNTSRKARAIGVLYVPRISGPRQTGSTLAADLCSCARSKESNDRATPGQ